MHCSIYDFIVSFTDPFILCMCQDPKKYNDITLVCNNNEDNDNTALITTHTHLYNNAIYTIQTCYLLNVCSFLRMVRDVVCWNKYCYTHKNIK